MKIREIILENVSHAQLETLKSVIAGKIKELPDDDATVKALDEIEELLKFVSAGGRQGMIDTKLKEINDEAVLKYRKILSRYLLSIPSTPKQREELFSMWKADKIVNIDKLLSKKQHNFEEIFNGYSTNSFIKEFIDDLMSEQALGQGKGEFGLNVLSKRITKPGAHEVNLSDKDTDKLKGDLLINGRKIEVKTTDGGSARFTDQEVAPAEGYEAAANSLLSFVKTNKHLSAGLKSFSKGVSGTGLNGKQALDLGQAIKGSKEAGQYFGLVRDVITKIFGGEKADQKMINNIMSAFESGNQGQFLQLYSQASLTYYMTQKEDEGVLAINIPTKNMVFYKDAKDLAAVGQRLNAETFYLTNTKDKRMPYPQLEVIPTTFGERNRQEQEYAAAQAAEKEREQRWKSSPQGQEDILGAESLPEIDKQLQLFISDLADERGITDSAKVNSMYTTAADWVTKNTKTNKTLAADQLFKYLVSKFPELKYQKQEPVAGPLTKKAQDAKKKQDELDVLKKNAGLTNQGMATV